MPQLETRALPSGATAALEIHANREGLSGVVAHWGEKLSMDTVYDRLAGQGVGENEFSRKSGFDVIYHQADNITRETAIEDELTVGELVGFESLQARGWEPTDVDAIVLGSGVPVVDNEQIDNYAGALAQRMGMRENIAAHSTYAACTSGIHEFIGALKDQSLQHKKVLLMGMEGVTALTPNLDIDRADPFSIQVFSNGAAGLAFVPGEDIILHASKHMVIPDTKSALAAHMTYERLLDPKSPDFWQEDTRRGLHMMRYPAPKEGRLLDLNQKLTSMFFTLNMLDFFGDFYNEYESTHPNEKIVYVAAHHASKPIHDGLTKRLTERKGIENLQMPWVVPDGNSSAATGLIAHNRLLPEAQGGNRIIIAGYGAGASFDIGVIEYAALS